MSKKKPTNSPQILAFAADSIQFIEAAEGENKLPRFSMTAYTGGAMKVGWGNLVVVDLAGMSIPSQRRPIRLQHDAMLGVGHTENIRIDTGKLLAEGVISRGTPAASEVVTSSKNGFPWQASIGASADSVEFVKAGETGTANGQVFQGPINIVRKSTLGEISFVDLGADGNTSANVAAQSAQIQQENDMPQSETDVKAATENADGGATKSVVEIEAKVSEIHTDDAIKAAREKLAVEAERVAKIGKICAGKHADIQAKAIREGWTTDKTELEVLRANRPTAPNVQVPDNTISGGVIEAALCQAGHLKNVESQFDEKTLEAAHKHFKGRIGLQQLLLEAAWSNGYSGRSFGNDMYGVVNAAFSTYSLPGIFSNTANKFLLAGFMDVERAYEKIAATRSVRDFKAVTSYRLIGNGQFQKVGPTGELKHGSMSEETFTNKVETYGEIGSITRQDIINDDLGALTTRQQSFGRDGALALNTVFWTEFMNNAAFFTAARSNYDDGADTALGIDSLSTAETMFLSAVGPDGKPMAIMPSMILVPPALKTKAMLLYGSTELRDTTASTKYPTNNPYAGMFEVVCSQYLANATITGYSSKAWYLMASPSVMPTIEIAYLNGVTSPTVEAVETAPNVLGATLRGYFDFGVAKQEYRGAVKMKGEV